MRTRSLTARAAGHRRIADACSARKVRSPRNSTPGRARTTRRRNCLDSY